MNELRSPSTAVVVADAPDADLTPYLDLIARADLIVAADGGARYLVALDRLSHVAVGDFDSLEPATLDQLAVAGVEILRHSPHKNETDLELALIQAIERGATCVYVLAALGGRPDQHLANLQLLAHPLLAHADVRLLQDGWEMFAIRSAATIYGNSGDRVSLMPLTDAVTGIVTDGLYYPLRDETLKLGPARGISNVLVGTDAQVKITGGILLCMHEGWQAPVNQEQA